MRKFIRKLNLLHAHTHKNGQDLIESAARSIIIT
jgi:hypothetical protein